jgi:predicted negative regulator of RcsB-dependent stress response
MPIKVVKQNVAQSVQQAQLKEAVKQVDLRSMQQAFKRTVDSTLKEIIERRVAERQQLMSRFRW